MNLIILKGHIGADPVIKSFEWGKTAGFSLATSESYTNKKGEKITETDWHNIAFTGPVCDVVQKYLHKGDHVIVTGKIKYRSYTDKENNVKYITEIKADSFEFCGSSKKDESRPDNREGQFQKNGKVTTGSLSEINDLPGHVAEQQGASESDTSDLPF